jgi:hypothetical protein
MRRTLLVAPMVIAAFALSTGAASAKPKPKPAPATFKAGTYSAKLGGPVPVKFNIALKRGSCASAPGQAKSSLHLCVVLPVSPPVACTTPINFETPIGSFVAPVQLPSSGTLTQLAPVTAGPAVPGGGPTPGQSSFAVAFTKKGTASGYLELNLQLAIQTQTITCPSGKIPFTAKLG